jgi:Protein of unknown function (DUF4089)
MKFAKMPRMNEPFEPAALVAVAAPWIGVELSPESRAAVVMHLKIATELAAKLDAIELGDEAEPAPVFTP